MPLQKHVFCTSITCGSCGEQMSGANERGFNQFIRTHMIYCGEDSFTISKSISAEVIL